MIKEIIRKNVLLIAVCAALFAAAVPLGYVYYDDTKGVLMPVLEGLKDLVGDKDKPGMAFAIFLNNYRVCIMLVAAGMLIIPIPLVMTVNGFMIGFIFKYTLEKGNDSTFFLKGILPHSVFELSAVLVSAAIGLRIGLSFLTLDNKKRAKNVSRAIREAGVMHLAVVLPLLLLAALIEVYVSAELIK